MRQALTTLAGSVLILAMFAIPISALGITFERLSARSRIRVGIRDGVLLATWKLEKPAQPMFAQRAYRLTVAGPERQDSASGGATWWRPLWEGGSTGLCVVPLWTVAVAGLVPLGIGYWRPVHVARRRIRRGLCLRCGYDLRGGQERCPECMAPRELPQPLRWPHAWVPHWEDFSRTVLRSAAGATVFIGLLSLGAWWLEACERGAVRENDLRVLDYTGYVRATCPRLSGVVATVGDGGTYPDLERALAQCGPGALLMLGQGIHDVKNRRRREEMALVGVARDETVLKLQVDQCRRVRIENVTIDCNNNPFVDLRGGGSMHLKNCRIRNYYSGAGGSVPIFGSGVVLLVENCVFDGFDGRARVSGAFGNAFDLRGESRLYARGTHFIDNSEIIRSCPSVFDGCTSTLASANESGIMVYAGPVWVRHNSARVRGGTPVTDFRWATDDAELAEGLLGGTRLNAEAQKLANALRLDKDPAYWIAMLRHGDAKTRAAAARRVTELTGQVVNLAGAGTAGAEVLTSDSSPDAALNGSAATSQSSLQGDTSLAIDARRQLRDLDPPLQVEVEYARLMAWLESQ